MSRSALSGRTSESLPDLHWLDGEGQLGRGVDLAMQTCFHTRFPLQSARSLLRQSPACLVGSRALSMARFWSAPPSKRGPGDGCGRVPYDRTAGQQGCLRCMSRAGPV